MGFPDLSKPRRALLSVDDFSESEIEFVLKSAESFLQEPRPVTAPRPFSVALLFLAPSLRTQVGFAAATIQLGGTPITLQSLRAGQEMSASEGLDDTLRVLSGMVDLIVVRAPASLNDSRARELVLCPLINGGDGGGNHPVQSFIDLFAIRRSLGPVSGLNVGLCGDLGSRSARSLLRLFRRFAPARIRLISPVVRQVQGIDVEFDTGQDRTNGPVRLLGSRYAIYGRLTARRW